MRTRQRCHHHHQNNTLLHRSLLSRSFLKEPLILKASGGRGGRGDFRGQDLQSLESLKKSKKTFKNVLSAAVPSFYNCCLPPKSWPLLRLPRLARRWLHFKKEDIKVNIKLYSAVLPQVKPSVSAKDAKEIYNLWDESRLFLQVHF